MRRRLRRLAWVGALVVGLALGVPACSRLATTYVTYVRHPVTGATLTVVTSSTAVTTSLHRVFAGHRNGTLARLQVGDPPDLSARGDCFEIGYDESGWVIDSASATVEARRPSRAALPYRLYDGTTVPVQNVVFGAC